MRSILRNSNHTTSKRKMAKPFSFTTTTITNYDRGIKTHEPERSSIKTIERVKEKKNIKKKRNINNERQKEQHQRSQEKIISQRKIKFQKEKQERKSGFNNFEGLFGNQIQQVGVRFLNKEES